MGLLRWACVVEMQAGQHDSALIEAAPALLPWCYQCQCHLCGSLLNDIPYHITPERSRAHLCAVAGSRAPLTSQEASQPLPSAEAPELPDHAPFPAAHAPQVWL